MGKGSGRRSGKNYSENYDKIFGKGEVMNREIKFRSWSKSNEMMIVFDLDRVANDVYQQKHLIDLMRGKHSDGEIMQFTGLQDKYGVDIYEGDWLQLIGAGVIQNVNKVKFYRGAFVVELDNELWTLGGMRSNDIEVIGNTHEAKK